MARFAVKDRLLDAQTLRTAGCTPYGGADIGECLAAARSVRGTDLDSWYDAWSGLAARTADLAEREAAAGRTETARLAFWRASSYDRNAGVMLLRAPLDPRLMAGNARQTELFRRGAALMARPPKTVELAWEGTTLPGYFFRCADSDGDPPRRTMIALGGYDSTAEELFFSNGAAALARGWNVLTFDGPGQGAALVQQGLTIRADWGSVITPVLDQLLERPEVDPDRVALVGLSLGAHLAPRAASTEHRLAACVADCGSFDLYAGALARVPGPLAEGLEDPHGVKGRALEAVLGLLARQPTGGWALRRGMLVHGVDSPLAYLRSLKEFSLVGHAEQIRCPTLVCYAEDDDISASAPQLFEALHCPKRLVRFSRAEGAGDHCESGARLLFHARAFGWLDEVVPA